VEFSAWKEKRAVPSPEVELGTTLRKKRKLGAAVRKKKRSQISRVERSGRNPAGKMAPRYQKKTLCRSKTAPSPRGKEQAAKAPPILKKEHHLGTASLQKHHFEQPKKGPKPFFIRRKLPFPTKNVDSSSNHASR